MQKQEKNNPIIKCPICDKIALQDQYGNGECKNCGWLFSDDYEKFENKTKVSYPMLVPTLTARQQYKNKQPFKASFEDFINGLNFYGEMRFEYKNKVYGVIFNRNNPKSEFYGKIELFEQNKNSNIYENIEDFVKKASIDKLLLKDIWEDVKNPCYMFCE